MGKCECCERPIWEPRKLIVAIEEDVSLGIERWLCPTCHQLALDELDAIRRQFKLLVDNGVSRDRAHLILMSKIKQEVLG